MRQHVSLIGQRFGLLVVEESLPSDSRGQRRWLCRCDCGNTHTATSANLNSGRTSHCGCRRSPDLTGQVFGRLTVLGRSDKRGSRGKRTVPLWECRCTCGAITYKATDTLTNPDESMCAACAEQHAAQRARQGAGYIAGTQISRIRTSKATSVSSTGHRGVYFDPRSQKYRARLRFQGKTMNFGYYDRLEDAIKARQKAEEEVFGKFLSEIGEE